MPMKPTLSQTVDHGDANLTTEMVFRNSRNGSGVVVEPVGAFPPCPNAVPLRSKTETATGKTYKV